MRKNIETADEILNLYFPVLDGTGFVAMVDYMGGDEAIERYARVSYGAGTRKTSDTRNLIRYLIRHYHSTPIESTEIAFHLALPIHVARQLVRHRTFSPINEYSGRYSVMPDLYYTLSKENFTVQSTNNKQGRSDEVVDDYDYFMKEITELRHKSTSLYKDMLEKGVAREVARMDLPLSTYTYWYCKMDLNNLFKMLRLRADGHAQWEIRQYANIMAGIAKRVAPLAFEAWVDYNQCASSFTRLDKEFLTGLLCEYNEGETYSIERIRQRFESHKESTLLKDTKMSKRELEEFWDKLTPPEIPDFDLDLSIAKDALFFEKLITEHS